jgi:hypothetical protein
MCAVTGLSMSGSAVTEALSKYRLRAKQRVSKDARFWLFIVPENILSVSWDLPVEAF